MSESATIAIPYEKQADFPANRMCGAAALSMVYASFGKPVPQAEVWPKISKHNRFGSLTAATHLIAQDALHRGFAALAIQATSPLLMLRLCREKGIRAILNHRLKPDVPTGHFTVLVDLDEKNVVLHDPYFGPSCRIAHAELLELWRPRYLNAEIAGNVLIGIASQPDSLPPCQVCRTVIPSSVDCPNCKKPVSLQPASLLGCVGAGCPARLWNYLCCPSCDHTWAFGLGDPKAAAALNSSEITTVDFGRMFAELDKVTSFILTLPQAASHPEVRQHLDSLKATKDKLTLTQNEQVAYRKIHMAELTQIQQKFKQDEQAILKKKEEMEKPGPALDGAALGQALLQHLGFFGEEKASTKPDSGVVAKPDKSQVDIIDHPLVRKAIRKLNKPARS